MDFRFEGLQPSHIESSTKEVLWERVPVIDKAVRKRAFEQVKALSFYISFAALVRPTAGGGTLEGTIFFKRSGIPSDCSL